MTEKEYRSHPAIANSDLSYIDKSQHHWNQYKLEGSISTSAMEMGTLFHACILEPDKFNELAVTETDFMKVHPEAVVNGSPNRRLKVYQEWKKNIPTDKILLTNEQMSDLIGMREMVYSHPLASKLLSMEGETEVPLFWGYMGVRCKCKVDRLVETDNECIVIDLKKTQDATDIDRTIIKYEYYRQLAYYGLGVEKLRGKPTRKIFIFCEEKAPHGVVVVELSPEYVAVGMDRVNGILNKYKNFLPEPPKTVYGEGLQIAAPPEWLINKIIENV